MKRVVMVGKDKNIEGGREGGERDERGMRASHESGGGGMSDAFQILRL